MNEHSQSFVILNSVRSNPNEAAEKAFRESLPICEDHNTLLHEYANATENIKNHQPEIDGYRVKFKTIDKDGKGYISEKQYIKYHNQNWKLIDKMEEGYVNKDEFTHGQNGKVHHKEKAFLEMDFNKDGKLTKKEFHLKKKLEFAQMDKDSNGKISEYEYFDANKMEEKYKMKENCEIIYNDIDTNDNIKKIRTSY